MKKRIISVIMTMVMACAVFSACGGNKIPSVEDQLKQAKSAFGTLSDEADARNEKREALINKNKIELKNNIVLEGPEVKVSVKAYSVIPWNTLGEDVTQIYFIFDYTNLNEEDRLFGQQVTIKGYQDGIELDPAPYWDDTATSFIRPNTRIERKEALVLRNKKSDVIVKLTDINTDEFVEFTIKLK